MKQDYWTYNKPLSLTGLGGGATSLLFKGVSEITLPNAGDINGYAQQQEITASNFISAGGTIIIPANLYVWSDDTSNPALTIDITCTIINEGIIMGRGGNGGSAVDGSNDGNDGGSAIKINSGVTGVIITNSSGAYIFGGGGGGSSGYSALYDSAGGGGGAGGGKGGRGSFETTLTAGGAIEASGSSSPRVEGGNGGGHGGSGGSSRINNASGNDLTDGCSGGGGGRKIASNAIVAPNPRGTNTARGRGGTGQNNNNVGGDATLRVQSINPAGGGGGGYGANGGIGRSGYTVGSGGKAIDDSGQTYTLTNNGTIYGGT
jgi:hypothetical protein|tara:strand:+ start:670 stop:1623 length:954 start_codon:yes stop_codon:yes gene_type:complete